MAQSNPRQDTIITTHSPADTETLGQKIGARLRPGDLLALSGELGAGKTCFVRGLARGWGAAERPTSPTFTLINQYHGPDGRLMYHVDCYRLENANDAWSTGLEDVLASGEIVVLEWPERIAEILPGERVWVSIESPGEDERELRFSAVGPRAEELLRGIEDPTAG